MDITICGATVHNHAEIRSYDRTGLQNLDRYYSGTCSKKDVTVHALLLKPSTTAVEVMIVTCDLNSFTTTRIVLYIHSHSLFQLLSAATLNYLGNALMQLAP
jgi:hypothetical protein